MLEKVGPVFDDSDQTRNSFNGIVVEEERLTRDSLVESMNDVVRGVQQCVNGDWVAVVKEYLNCGIDLPLCGVNFADLESSHDLPHWLTLSSDFPAIRCYSVACLRSGD